MPAVRSICVGLALAAAGSGAQRAGAAVAAWNKPAGGVFQSADSWQPSAIPGPSDLARFELGGAYTVDLTSDSTNRRLLMGEDKVVFDLGDRLYRLTNSGAASIVLGLDDGDDVPSVARAIFRNGELRSVHTTLAEDDDASASLILTRGASWRNTGRLQVGAAGAGNMTITRGAEVTTRMAGLGVDRDSRGTALVNGRDSFWKVQRNLRVGSRRGVGRVTVQRAGELDVDRRLSISRNGVVTLKGGTLSAGSIARSGELRFLQGTLNITASDLTLQPGGPLGTNLILNASRQVNVTRATHLPANASLVLSNGRFSSGGTIFNAGQIRLTGNSQLGGGSLQNDGLLRGNGSVAGAVNNAGTVRVLQGQQLAFGGNVLNNGAIDLQGGILRFAQGNAAFTNATPGSLTGWGSIFAPGGFINSGLLNLISSPASVTGPFVNQGTGQVQIANVSAIFRGTVAHNGQVFSVAPNSDAVFEDDVTGAGDFTGGGDIEFQALYSPGNSIATVNFDADVTFGQSASLLLELGPGKMADRLNVDGNISLADVEIAVRSGFQGEVGERYVLIAANSINYDGPVRLTTPGAFELQVQQQSDELAVLVVPEPSGLALIGALAGLLMRRRRS